MSGEVSIHWNAPGPVSMHFMNSMAPVQALQGPIGSGKTGTALMKFIKLAAAQPPSPIDGVSRFKGCVVRDTYRQLAKSTLPSWHKWMSKDTGRFAGGNNEPAVHEIQFDYGGRRIELTMDFVAIGHDNYEDVLRGYEPTAFLLEELDLLAPEVLSYCRGRAGRFPTMAHGGPHWYGVLATFNAPDIDNYCYDLFVDDLPEDWAYFRQPSGLSPQAENLRNLPPGYYANQISGQPEWYVRRMIKNEFGWSRAGQPVYPEFIDQFHVAAESLKAIEGLPLLIGADAGRTPAAIFGQIEPNGRWRILDELVRENMGARTFGREVNRFLASRYPGFIYEAWGDPAAGYKGDTDEMTWLEIVGQETGFPWRPAPVPNNDITMRLEAVRQPLELLIDAAAGFQLSPTCTVLRRGFNSGYRFQRIRGAGGDRYADKPEKNASSHPHDALQYVMLGGGGYSAVMGRKRSRGAALGQVRAIEDDGMAGGAYGGGGFSEGRDRGMQAFAVTD